MISNRFILALFTLLSTLVFADGYTGWPVSKTYKDVQTFMKDVVSKNSDRAVMFDLGDSDSGQKIQGIKVGNGPVQTLVVATHHGNEYGSTEVGKAFAKSVAEAPIKGQTIYIIPVLNIGGYNARTRWEKSLDPNRDYPGPCGTAGPFKLKSTKALADFIAAQKITASATLHTYSPAVVYPWGISTHDLSTPYDDQYKQLVQAATVESQYQTGNNTEVLYPADGTFEDYAYWKHGIWSLLFELGVTHNPDQSQVEEMLRVNVPGLRRFLEQAPTQLADNHGFTGKCDTKMKLTLPQKWE